MNDCAICGGPEADHGVLNGYPDKHAFEPRVEDEGSPPDGLVILHYHPEDPDRTTPTYGIGPFPPDEELIAKVVAGQDCDCRKVVIGVAFPAHTKMVVVVDPEDVMAALREIAEVDSALLN